MNLETQSFSLSSVKNELKYPSENINPYELVYLFERCKKNGSLDDAIRISKRQDRIWGYNKMNSSSNNKSNTPGAQKSPAGQNNLIPNPRSGELVATESAQEPEQAGTSVAIASQQPSWSQFHASPSGLRAADDRWLEPENFEEHFVSTVSLIGDREKYAENEYVREWLNSRQIKPGWVLIEPILWHIHRLDPPGFILSTAGFPGERTLIDLLRTFRHPYLGYRKKTICVFVERSQIETLMNKLNLQKISAVVLSEDQSQNFHESNSVFLTTHARHVGNHPVDNLINYHMFRTLNEYVDRQRLLRRRGHMTTFFNPDSDSDIVPSLVEESRKRRVEIPAFLKEIAWEKTEFERC